MPVVTARRGLLALAVTGALVAIAAAGCGKSGPAPITSAQLARGRALFQTGASEGCSFCHTLAAADTVSVIGPGLDGEMREIDQRKVTNDQLAQYVRHWIDNGECLNPADATRCMPSQIFTGADADAVAAFVAVCGRTPTHPGCKPVASAMPAEVSRGERLFETRGCVSCHFSDGDASAGPPLVGVAGSKVELANGARVTADATYLTESIAAPNRQIVNGYQRDVMSAIVDQEGLSRAQISALVAFIQSLTRGAG
jgi:cytochrome c oxidase subunit 2